MADRIELRDGCAPWRPTPDSELVVTYRYYDGPLSGVIRQHGNDYTFMCLDGADETVSLWWFAPISAEQRERLESLPPEQFEQAFNNENFYGCVTLALVTPRIGILDFEHIEETYDRDLEKKRARAALRALLARLADVKDQADHLELLSM